jgi:dTDP-4-dehydrorhamnose reductase
MRVAITGACGLLGAHLAASLSRAHEVTGLDQSPWWGDQPIRILAGDLRDATFRRAALAAAAPEVLIHCAAMIDVDACETDTAAAYEMNGAVTGALARLAGPECLFVYITTDSLFRGDRPFAAENDRPCPRTVYARSKLHGEWETELATDHHLIVRTNFYGWSSGRTKTFGEWLHDALEGRECITLFDDAFFTPTYVVDLVRNIEALVAGGRRGIFHVCGRDRVSKYEFGAELARQAGFSMSAVRRGSIDAAGLAASRPKDMSLDTAKFRNAVGREAPSSAQGISRFLADRHRALSARADSGV